MAEKNASDSDVAHDDDDDEPYFDEPVTSDDVTVDDPFDLIDVESQSPTAEQNLRYFGADFDVEGIVRRLGRNELQIPTFSPESSTDLGFEGFQRRFVWPKKQMDRFVESLLLGYPVPGIFLVELQTRQYLVLDGQQRLRTLAAFYNGIYAQGGSTRKFQLTYVSAAFKGRTYETLEDADRRLLDNTFIQATVIVPGDRGKDSVYKLFERINSSGVKLQPQEIRVALYSGPVIRFIRDLNAVPPWRSLFGREHSRLKDHELILRYLSLMECAEFIREFTWDLRAARAYEAEQGIEQSESVVYKPPMSSFLNRYLERHEKMQGIDSVGIFEEFETVCESLYESAGRDALRWRGGTQVNAAHTDALLVGATIAHRVGVELSSNVVASALASLRNNESYVEALSESTSHADNVVARLRYAVAAFGVS